MDGQTRGTASAGRRLRDAIAAAKPMVTVAGGNAQHAQLAQAAGFSSFGISGANVSTGMLGLPDAGFLTLTELAMAARWICRAVHIPVIVDCDTGFGNAINARRTVKEMIRAGAGGLFIEDQVAPKRCGFVKGKRLIPLDEAVGKYRACLDMRDELDSDFVVMARTDARGAADGGMDEALRRTEAYLAAGVDVIYVEALQTREEFRAVRERFPDCILKATTMAVDPPLTLDEMAELGIDIASFHVGRVGAIAMHDFLRRYKAEGHDAWNRFTAETADHPIGGFRIFDLTGFPAVAEMEKRYLPKEETDRYETSIGMYDPRAGRAAE